MASIDAALELARDLDCGLVHVVSGVGDGEAAREAYEGALEYACDVADDGTTIGIEPISRDVAEGYFLNSFDLAAEIIQDFARPNLGMIYDFYHAHLMGIDPLEGYRPISNHICAVQICGLPGRNEPTEVELTYVEEIGKSGYDGPIGAEYLPTDMSAGWLKYI